jgi:hypothetical protein
MKSRTKPALRVVAAAQMQLIVGPIQGVLRDVKHALRRTGRARAARQSGARPQHPRGGAVRRGALRPNQLSRIRHPS